MIKKPSSASSGSPRKAARSFVDIAASRHAELASIVGKASHELDVEAVHDLRVASRRITQIHRLFKPLLDRTTAQAISLALRDLRQAAGELRDLDVMHEHFEKWPMHDIKIAPLLAMTAPMIARYPQQRKKLANKLHHVLTCVSTSAGLRAIDALVTQLKQKKNATFFSILDDELSALLSKRHRQFRKSLARTAAEQTPHEFHQARIAAKKLRYLLEIADELGRPGHQEQLAALKQLQSQLGDMHDADVILSELQAQVARTKQAPIRDAWRSFCQQIMAQQSQRAAFFFQFSYRWHNELASLLNKNL